AGAAGWTRGDCGAMAHAATGAASHPRGPGLPAAVLARGIAFLHAQPLHDLARPRTLEVDEARACAHQARLRTRIEHLDPGNDLLAAAVGHRQLELDLVKRVDHQRCGEQQLQSARGQVDRAAEHALGHHVEHRRITVDRMAPAAPGFYAGDGVHAGTPPATAPGWRTVQASPPAIRRAIMSTSSMISGPSETLSRSRSGSGMCSHTRACRKPPVPAENAIVSPADKIGRAHV